jgi:hypothetical protein
LLIFFKSIQANITKKKISGKKREDIFKRKKIKENSFEHKDVIFPTERLH